MKKIFNYTFIVGAAAVGILLVVNSCKKDDEPIVDLEEEYSAERREFERKYIETIKAGEHSSDHIIFYDFSEPFVVATINFDASNLEGSLGTGCDGDWNKTIGVMLPGSVDPHDNSGRFVHRLKGPDYNQLEIGHYTHRKGYIYSTDTAGVVDSTLVDDLISDALMSIDVNTDYKVKVAYSSGYMNYYIGDSLVQATEMPLATSGAYVALHYYHGGDCPANNDQTLSVTYHAK